MPKNHTLSNVIGNYEGRVHLINGAAILDCFMLVIIFLLQGQQEYIVYDVFFPRTQQHILKGLSSQYMKYNSKTK